MCGKHGRIIADVSNRNLKTTKWVLTVGTFVGAVFAIFATRFSMSLSPDMMFITIVFLANVFLFAAASIFVWLYFSSKEIIIYEDGMKIPNSRFSSRHVRYDKIKSIDLYAKGGNVIIRTETRDLEVTKGIIGKWGVFVKMLKDKGLINENGDMEP